MRRLLAHLLALAVLGLGTAAYAQTGNSGNDDKKDARNDRRDLNKDRKDINKDKQDLNKDRADRNKDARDLNKDRKDLSKDKRDLREDVKEGDKKDIYPPLPPIRYRSWIDRIFVSQRNVALPRDPEEFDTKIAELANEILNLTFQIIQSVPA